MKTIIVIFFVCVLFSCSDDSQFIKNIANKYRDYQILIVIPIKSNNGISETCLSSTELFQHDYLKKYSEEYPDYYSFLKNVISKNLILKDTDLMIPRNYDVNKHSLLFDEYKNNGLNYIVSKYLNRKGQKLAVNKNLDWNDRGALIKIMFEEKYYSIDDDYSGEVWFFKDFNNK